MLGTTRSGATGHPASKARIQAMTLLDIAIDLFVPTLVVLALRPTGLSDVICLTVGGFVVAAKAGAGRVATAADGDRRVVLTTLGINLAFAVAASAITIIVSIAGASDIEAILAGAIPFAIVAAVRLWRGRRRLDRFALLVLVELATSIVLVSISDDPRFVLMRPAFYTTAAGIFALWTVFTTRPFMIDASKPMAVGNDPLRAVAFERAAVESPAFLATERLMTVMLAVALFAEAALRVVVVMSHPAADIVTLSISAQIPGIVVLVAFVVALKVMVPRASRAVDEFMPTDASG